MMTHGPHDSGSHTVRTDGGRSLTASAVRQESSNTHQTLSNGSLNIPSEFQRRRSSLESVFSELSELTILAHGHNDQLLTRRRSNASYVSDTSGRSTSSIYSTAPRRSSLRRWLSRFYDDNYGALLVLLSQLFGALMNIFTRLLEHEGPHGAPMHPFQILFVRQSLTALLCTIYALTTKSIPHFPLGPPDRTVRLLLVCRGLTGFFGVFGMYFSLLYLPLSEATVLTFLAPVLTCYLCSYLIPGETFTRQQQLAGFLSLAGIVFIAQPASFFASSAASSVPAAADSVMGAGDSLPASGLNTTNFETGTHQFVEPTPSPTQHLLAVLVAMVGVLGATGAITSIRAIGTRAHAFISVNYFSTWSSIVCLVALLVIPGVEFRLPANVTEWGLLVSLGTCGFVMQGLLTVGLAYKATGRGGGSGQPKVERSSLHRKKSTDASGTRGESSVEGEMGDIEMQIHAGHLSNAGASTSSSQPFPNLTLDRDSSSRSRRQHKKSAPSTASSSGTKATSMLYTQMLFALAGDRIVFGTTPGVWSWVGSGLILAGAIWVASATEKPKIGGSNTNKIRQSGDGASIEEIIVHATDKTREESLGLLQNQEDERANDSDEDQVRVGERSSRI